MNVVPVAEVKARFGTYLEQSRNGPVVVTRHGRAVAVLLNVRDDDELEHILLAHSPRFQAMLDRAEERIRETGGLTHQDFWQMVEGEA